MKFENRLPIHLVRLDETHKDSQGIGLTQKAPYAHLRVAGGAACAPLRGVCLILRPRPVLSTLACFPSFTATARVLDS